MKNQILLSLLVLLSFNCIAYNDAKTINFEMAFFETADNMNNPVLGVFEEPFFKNRQNFPIKPDSGKPDTIIIDVDDSTSVIIISNTAKMFSSLETLSFDSVIESLLELSKNPMFNSSSDSLIEFELENIHTDEILKEQELVFKIQEGQIKSEEEILRKLEKLELLEHLKDLQYLRESERLDSLVDAGDIEDWFENENLESEENHIDYKDRKKDQIIISANVGAGLIRDKISPSADIFLSFEINDYYYAAVSNFNFTFYQKANNKYDMHNNLFLGLEFGLRYDSKKKQNNKTYFNRVGLSYLVKQQGDYFGDNTLKLYYGVEAGPVIIQPQLITTNNFEQWFPSIGFKVRL